MFTWCTKQKASIIFLQETHSTIDKEKQWKAEWGTSIKYAHGSSSARGVAILLRNGFDCKIKRRIVHPMGRYIGMKAEIKDANYLLFNFYAPNNDSQSAKFYEWRFKHSNEKSFTWSQKSPFIFCRLDYYWPISDSSYDMVGNVDIVSAIKTDHSTITLQLHKTEEGAKGPGFC